MELTSDKIVYIYSEELISECDRLPTMLKRASMVQDLVNSYKLLLDDKFLVVRCRAATEEELRSFHSGDYVEFLKKTNELIDYNVEEELQEFGLHYDCPLLPRSYDLVRVISGSSVSAAKLITSKKFKTVINWFGGWHHAQRDCAEGFCYVNDIVIAVQILNQVFDKILYVDLDIHHGNGVQNAFEYSNRILTLSFHKKVPGFYPGTGDIEEVGRSNGKYYSINVPLMEGIGHEGYLKLFKEIFASVFTSFQPNCMVVQCGADGLNGDSVGGSNITLRTFGECVEEIMRCDLPTLFLGGGGYNFANTSRLWTYLTSVIAGITLDNDIPDGSEFFPKYGPSYELHIDSSLQKDKNSDEYIASVIRQIQMYCTFIK